MSLTQTVSDIHPEAFTVGADVTHEDVVAVIRMLAWIGGNNPQVIASMTSGAYQWGGSEEVATHDITSQVTSKTEFYRFWHFINEDVTELEIIAEMNMPASHTCRIEVDVGTDAIDTAADMDFTDTDNGLVRTGDITIAVTGWQLCIISLYHTVGSTSDFELISWTLAEKKVTTSLPALVDE